MDIIKTIRRQQLAYWSWRGLVQATFSSSTLLGKGVRAQEVRIHAEDGTHRTVILSREIPMERDDDISLVYARGVRSSKGVLVGVANHTRQSVLAMPQGVTPIKLRAPWPVRLIKRVERFSLLGAVTLLSSVAALWLHVLADLRFSLLLWFVIGAAELTLLWSVTVIADWWEDSGARAILAETNTVLHQLTFAGASGTDMLFSESRPSRFLKGDPPAADARSLTSHQPVDTKDWQVPVGNQ